MLATLRQRWEMPNGYRDVLHIGFPLIVSMGATTIMEFTDRVFVSHYSLDAIAAAAPAGFANLVSLLFFMGVAGYVNVFIAQYVGSNAPERAGASLWQAIYFSFFGAAILASMAFLARPLFELVGHERSVLELEIVYFRILTVGSGAALLASALGCFFSGRGITRPNMVVNIIAAVINIPLDYMLIFGVGPFPEMGIAGAGIATASSWSMQVIMYAVLVFTKHNDKKFAVWRNRRFDKKLFARMMRFGLPSGVNLFFELFAAAFFAFMVGKIGQVELAASNIVFSINSVAFLPMIGLNVAISTLVGQAMGRGKTEDAVLATRHTVHIALLWMGCMSLIFLLFPEQLFGLFKPSGLAGEEFMAIQDTGVVLLRFLVLYALFDPFSIVYFGAVKGAGDTHFVMWTMVTTGILVLALPLVIVHHYFNAELIVFWGIFSLYISILMVVATWRFYKGPWRTMRVVETTSISEE